MYRDRVRHWWEHGTKAVLASESAGMSPGVLCFVASYFKKLLKSQANFGTWSFYMSISN